MKTSTHLFALAALVNLMGCGGFKTSSGGNDGTTITTSFACDIPSMDGAHVCLVETFTGADAVTALAKEKDLCTSDFSGTIVAACSAAGVGATCQAQKAKNGQTFAVDVSVYSTNSSFAKTECDSFTSGFQN